MKRSLMIVLAILLTAGAASAGSTVTLPVNTKEVAVGGSTTYEVVLDTSHAGPGTMSWTTSDSAITAKLDVAGLDTSGQINVITVPNVPQSHTLTVAVGSGAVVGKEYSVDVNYCFGNPAVCDNGKIKAKAEATVIPTPELSTSILTATGLIGFVGLMKVRRKK